MTYTEEGIVLGRTIGSIDYSSELLTIIGLAVDKEARGKRIGRQLLKEIEGIATKEACSLVLLETNSISAPQFYEKQGYSLLGTIGDYPIEGIENYYYYKRLQQ